MGRDTVLCALRFIQTSPLQTAETETASAPARNQLATVKDANNGATLASFVYDPFGRRLQNSGGDGVLYDGANEAQELSGSTPVVNRLTGGVDEFFSRTDSAGTTFPLTDALGSTIALTDSTGTVQTQYTYDPFGGTTATGAMSTNTYQYTGRVSDGTGLYYYRARYYSPRFQRFISQDPIGFDGDDPNLYAYVHNNPINLIDPLGLKVTIVIGNRTYSSTGNSVSGTITVTSDQTTESFSGYTMENAHAGDEGNKPPIPPGTYDAFPRTDHTPNRIELRNVPGYNNIQIHNGSYPRNFRGCFGAGTSHSTDFLGGTTNSINQINSIVQADGSGDITVIVGPIK